MSLNLLHKMLTRFYNRNAYHKARYRKAAKKARVLKKWRARFGEDLDGRLENLIPTTSILSRVTKGGEFSGRALTIPEDL